MTRPLESSSSRESVDSQRQSESNSALASAIALASAPLSTSSSMTDPYDRDSIEATTLRRKQAVADTSRAASRPGHYAFDVTPAPSGNWRRSSGTTAFKPRAESKETSEQAEMAKEAASPTTEWEQENRPQSSPPVMESRPADRTEPAGIEPAADLARPLAVKSAVSVLRRVDSSSPSLAAVESRQSTHCQLQSEQKQQQQQWQSEFAQEQQSLSSSRPISTAAASPPLAAASGPARAIHVDEVMMQQAGFESSTLLVCPLHPLITAQTLGALFSPYGAVRINIVLSAVQGLAAVLQFESIAEARSAFIALDRMMLQLEVDRNASENEQVLRVIDAVMHTLQLHFVAPAAGGSGVPDVRCSQRITAQLVRTQEDYQRMQMRS